MTTQYPDSLYVYSAVPPNSNRLLRKYGLMSGVETIKHPEVLKTARPDAKQRKDFVKMVKKIASSDRPYSVMGPSVLFTLPDPDKVTDKHFIKQWELQTIRIDLGRLVKDYPDTVVWGVELLPYNYAWREMTDEEFEEEIAGLGFSSWEEFRDARSRPLGLDEVYDFTLTDPVELWAHYPKSDIGKKYASNVPHAFIITPMGYIPYKYIEYVDEARSNPSEDGPEMLEDIDIVIDYYRDCGVYGFGGQCVLAAEIVFDEVTDFGNLNFPDRLEIVAVWHTFSLTVLKQPRGHVCLRYFIGGDRKSPEAYVYIDSDLQEKEYDSIESWGHVDLETMQSELDLDDDPRLENYGDKEEFGTTTLSFANLDEFKASPSYRMFCKNTAHNDDVDGSRSNPTDDHIKIKFSFSALLRYFEFVNEYTFYDEVDIVSADFLFAEFAQHITLYRVLDQREMYFISTEGDFGGGRFNTEIERATGAAFAATSIQDVVGWGRAWRERGRLVGDLYVLEVDGFKRVFSSLRSPEDMGIDVSGLNDALNAYRKGSISAEEGIERCGLLDREYSVPRSTLCTTGLGCSIRLKEWDQFKVYKVIGDGVQEIDGIPIDIELPPSEYACREYTKRIYTTLLNKRMQNFGVLTHVRMHTTPFYFAHFTDNEEDIASEGFRGRTDELIDTKRTVGDIEREGHIFAFRLEGESLSEAYTYIERMFDEAEAAYLEEIPDDVEDEDEGAIFDWSPIGIYGLGLVISKARMGVEIFHPGDQEMQMIIPIACIDESEKLVVSNFFEQYGLEEL